MAKVDQRYFFARTWIILFGVVLLGLVLSVEIYRRALKQDEAYVALEFARRAGIRHSMTLDMVKHYEEAVATVGTYFAINPRTSREDFALIAGRVIREHPGFRNLSWIPEIARADRKDYEKAAVSDLKRAFSFTRRSPSGELEALPEADFIHPVLYREPTFAGDPMIGYQTSQEEAQRSLLKARGTGKITVVNGLNFFQQAEEGRAIILNYPVFRLKDDTGPGNKAGTFAGIVRAAFHDKEFFQALRGLPGSAMDMAFIDQAEADPNRRILDFSPADGDSPSTARALSPDYHKGLHIEQPFAVGDRQWRVVYLPKPGWEDTQTRQHPLLQLLAGVVVTGFISALVFITIQKRILVEKLVTQRTNERDISQSHLNHLLATLPGTLFRYRWDDHFTVLSLTPSIEQLTGYPPEEFTSGRMKLQDVIHPDDLAATLPVRKNAIEGHHPYEVEFRIRTQDQRERWVLSRGHGIYKEGNELLYVEGLAIDITERKAAELHRLEMERKLHEGQKLESLGLLASGVAHDFSNLLLGITGNVALARMHLGANSSLHPRLKKIEEAASRASELCRQMLDFTGRSYTLLEPVDLPALVKNLMPLLSHSFRGNTQLLISGDENLPPARADSVQLRQAIMNLVINAADAVTPDAGQITIKFGVRDFTHSDLKKAVAGAEIPPGQYLFLEVGDNGCGISPDVLSKIFDPFFTTKPSGRGLGLASLFGIIRNHAGALLLQTEAGKGTLFKIILPLA